MEVVQPTEEELEEARRVEALLQNSSGAHHREAKIAGIRPTEKVTPRGAPIAVVLFLATNARVSCCALCVRVWCVVCACVLCVLCACAVRVVSWVSSCRRGRSRCRSRSWPSSAPRRAPSPSSSPKKVCSSPFRAYEQAHQKTTHTHPSVRVVSCAVCVVLCQQRGSDWRWRGARRR
jgi:hypothetical protein